MVAHCLLEKRIRYRHTLRRSTSERTRRRWDSRASMARWDRLSARTLAARANTFFRLRRRRKRKAIASLP